MGKETKFGPLRFFSRSKKHEALDSLPVAYHTSEAVSSDSYEDPMTSTQNLDLSNAKPYHPLQGATSIRLVTLKRSGNGSDFWIQCNLVDIDLATNPVYYAISYEWDYQWSKEESETKEILVNGQLMVVKDNLYNALVRFSSDDVPALENPLLRPGTTFFWIDALCINQDDVLERNHQVGLMCKIYSESKCVLVWLGLQHQSLPFGWNKRVMTVMEKVPNVRGSEKAVHKFVKKTLYSYEDKWMMDKDWPYIVARWCNASYWHRMWITQEIQLAKQLHIYTGDSHMSWSSLTQARRYFDRVYGPHSRMKSTRWAAFSLDYNRNQRSLWKLKELMVLRQGAKCSEVRDRVYALLSLATDTHGKLEADYSRSLSDLYREVMKIYILPDNSIPPVYTYNLVAFSSFLQKILTPYDPAPEYIKLTDEDVTPIWVCGYIIGSITIVENPEKAFSPAIPLSRATAIPDEQLPAAEQLIWTTCPSSHELTARIEAPRKKPRVFQFEKQGLNRSNAQRCVPKKVKLSHARRAAWSITVGSAAPSWTGPSHYVELHGAGPEDSRLGDLVCGFPKSDIALVFRHDSKSDELQLIGKAVMDFGAGKTEYPVRLNVFEEALMWNNNPNDPSTMTAIPERAVYLRLHLGVLQLLTCPSRLFRHAPPEGTTV
jgi:hypothetical protein